MNTARRHVVFGTGAIGLATLDALRRRGERVRLVNRSGTTSEPSRALAAGLAPPGTTSSRVAASPPGCI